MSKSRIFFGAALCSLTLAGAPAAQESDGFGNAKATTLTEMRSRPQAYKNVWVKFTGLFLATGSLHNPFFTRFTRSEFVNFAVWGDEQKIWDKTEYDNACSTLFVSKKADLPIQTVYELQRYQHVECVGIVRNAFQGEPWVEITGITVLPERVPTATIAHMVKATKHIKDHDWKKAGVELNLAWTDGLTPQFRGWISNYRGICLMRIGKWQAARQQLTQAKMALPTELSIDGHLKTLQDNPKAAIDSTVKAQLPRGKRPFWEAVEKADGSTGTTIGKKPNPTKAPSKTTTETTKKKSVAGPGK